MAAVGSRRLRKSGVFCWYSHSSALIRGGFEVRPVHDGDPLLVLRFELTSIQPAGMRRGVVRREGVPDGAHQSRGFGTSPPEACRPLGFRPTIAVTSGQPDCSGAARPLGSQEG